MRPIWSVASRSWWTRRTTRKRRRSAATSSATQMMLRVSVKPVEQTEQRQEERETRAAQGTASAGGIERVQARRPVAVGAGATAGANGGGAKGKIGRNDPCYCGSGKKYKKCHGR